MESTNKINAFTAVSGPFWSFAIPLTKDSIIFAGSSKNLFYYDSAECLMAMELCDIPSYCSYGWKGMNDKYLGLRFNIDGKTHYGWARLDVTSSAQWIIKDYAYNATSNKSILAGQMK